MKPTMTLTITLPTATAKALAGFAPFAPERRYGRGGTLTDVVLRDRNGRPFCGGFTSVPDATWIAEVLNATDTAWTAEAGGIPTSASTGDRGDQPMYLIQRSDGAFVRPPGMPGSYTFDLRLARTFYTREDAERECCGNERVVRVDEVLTRPERRT